MGPKKPPNKDAKKGAVGDDGEEPVDPATILQNYQKFSRMIGLTPHISVAKAFEPDALESGDIFVDGSLASFGPGGTRSLLTSIMNMGPGMKGKPLNIFSSLRFWKCNIGDDGVNSVAEVLRLGGGDVIITYLEILDDIIGPKGALALGHSLSFGQNLSLQILKLDYNINFGVEGTYNLCRGIRTNRIIRELHLSYCNIGAEGGQSLSDVIANSKSALEVLNLSGNQLGGKGLSYLCEGLNINSRLERLYLADNQIDQNDDDLLALKEFNDCLLGPSCNLNAIDLRCNRIGPQGASLLLPALAPERDRIKEFFVDVTLPLELFEQLFRSVGGGKKKGKKKKGGKKKKK